MRIRHLLPAAALLAVVALPAGAQNCAAVAASPGLVGGAAYPGFAGFTDVLQSNQFCPEVEWVRNRSITLGCGAGTAYCPNDPVTRLQMAIFLKREGDKLTPTIIEPVPSSTPCRSWTFPPRGASSAARPASS
ncbi:MAG: S-layer homology domain-containing protein [Betaproteobacteria bacterium]|nr:S-layer homology domain-containing protein [Betaproteobacteria bacterium]